MKCRGLIIYLGSWIGCGLKICQAGVCRLFERQYVPYDCVVTVAAFFIDTSLPIYMPSTRCLSGPQYLVVSVVPQTCLHSASAYPSSICKVLTGQLPIYLLCSIRESVPRDGLSRPINQKVDKYVGSRHIQETSGTRIQELTMYGGVMSTDTITTLQSVLPYCVILVV
jgi:hypothetical protein